MSKIINEITAPYNFVPVSGWIYQPDWKEKISHDIPLKDGLSGTLEITVNAHSPILIGKPDNKDEKEKKEKSNQPNEVHFFEAGDKFAIPGSSLKGMIRNVMEIASFAKMRMVDDQRLGIRDISGGGHMRDIYAARMKNQKAGFLRLIQSKEKGIVAELIPCEYAHIRHNDLKKHLDYSSCLFKRGQSVKQKYKRWVSLTHTDNPNRLPKINFITQRQNRQQHITLATPRNDGRFKGELVFTGQISDKCPSHGGKSNRYGKYRDFVFYNKKTDAPLKVSSSLFDDFRRIHREEKNNKNKTSKKNVEKKLQNNRSWDDYWKERFENGEMIPVFYHANGKRIKSMGLAYMYKLAYTNSIGETLAHTNPLHHQQTVTDHDLQEQDEYDLPELLMGMIDASESKDKQNKSLKSRVSFGLCTITDGSITPEAMPATILNGPKPTYFPNYIHQPQAEKGRLPDKTIYTTYMNREAEIRGWKRYPARPDNHVRVQRLDSKQEENKKVQTILHPLPKGSTFKGKIRFHNLKPEELGALLWSLQLGESSNNHRHGLGMGKPFGFGQVSIEVNKASIFHNKTLKTESYKQESLCNLITENAARYTELMNDHYQDANSNKQGWKDSTQIKNLLAMTNPENSLAQQGKLKHMIMGMGNNNEFVKAKTEGFVLPVYEDSALPDTDLFPRKSAELLKRKVLEEQEEQQQQEAEKKRQKELEKLPEWRRKMEEAKDATPQLREHLALIKALEAGTWENDDRRKVAEYVKKIMQEQKLWKESSAKKNPRKDKNHQLTLKLKDILDI